MTNFPGGIRYWVLFLLGISITYAVLFFVAPQIDSLPRSILQGLMLVAWAVYYHWLRMSEPRRRKADD